MMGWPQEHIFDAEVGGNLHWWTASLVNLGSDFSKPVIRAISLLKVHSDGQTAPRCAVCSCARAE